MGSGRNNLEYVIGALCVLFQLKVMFCVWICFCFLFIIQYVFFHVCFVVLVGIGEDLVGLDSSEYGLLPVIIIQQIITNYAPLQASI